MFDDLLRQLKRSLPETQTIAIDMHLDEAGYCDRRCPAEECGSSFKVLFSDWKAKVPDEQAWCPICGEIAEPPAFQTPEQRRQIRETAIAMVASQFDEAARRAHKPKINAGGLITMSWSYKPGARSAVVPASAEPVMSQQSECEVCGCHYASVGAAFFCPACGHNNARSTFAGSIKTVRDTVDLAERMPTLIADRDVAADTARQMLETSLARVWSSFQRFAEAAYAATPASAAAPARRNAFQSLEASATLWQGAIGKSYTRTCLPHPRRPIWFGSCRRATSSSTSTAWSMRTTWPSPATTATASASVWS